MKDKDPGQEAISWMKEIRRTREEENRSLEQERQRRQALREEMQTERRRQRQDMER